MTDQAKKSGKPAAAPDKGEVSDADLEKVSGGTGSPPYTDDRTRQLQIDEPPSGGTGPTSVGA